MNVQNVTKYFKPPTTGVIRNKDRWKYTVATVVRDVAETIFYILVAGFVCWLALYSFFNLGEQDGEQQDESVGSAGIYPMWAVQLPAYDVQLQQQA